MTYYAVVDTNVLVSALLSKNDDSATVKVLNYIINGTVIPLYSAEIISEYKEVLSREKFGFDLAKISYLLLAIEKFGFLVSPSKSKVILPNIKDLPFYEVVLEKKNENAYLVTENIKHFIKESFIVTPAEFIKIIGK